MKSYCHFAAFHQKYGLLVKQKSSNPPIRKRWTFLIRLKMTSCLMMEAGDIFGKDSFFATVLAKNCFGQKERATWNLAVLKSLIPVLISWRGIVCLLKLNQKE
jgi:hypothetical protein